MKNKKRILLWTVGVLVLVGIFLSSRLWWANFFFQKGQYYYNGGTFDLKQARKYYDWSLIINSTQPYAHYQLARIDLVEGNVEAGLQEIDKELKVNPQNNKVYYVKGLLDNYGKRYSQAQQDFQKYIELAPEGWAGYVDLSWSYLSDGKYEEAIDTTIKGFEKYPQNCWLYSNQGLAYYKMGDYEKAKNSLEQAKKYAADLTPEDWRKAYPGNDAAKAEQGVSEIKAAISYNLSLAYKNLGQVEDYLLENREYQNLLRK